MYYIIHKIDLAYSIRLIHVCFVWLMLCVLMLLMINKPRFDVKSVSATCSFSDTSEERTAAGSRWALWCSQAAENERSRKKKPFLKSGAYILHLSSCSSFHFLTGRLNSLVMKSTERELNRYFNGGKLFSKGKNSYIVCYRKLSKIFHAL